MSGFDCLWSPDSIGFHIDGLAEICRGLGDSSEFEAAPDVFHTLAEILADFGHRLTASDLSTSGVAKATVTLTAPDPAVA